MPVAVAAIVFGIILIAELPDKTMFASLMLGTRFAARWVFLGAAMAFVIHVLIAVTAGSLLGLLPHRVLDVIIAGLFLLGAAFMLHEARSPHTEAEGVAAAEETVGKGSALAPIATSFVVIFIGEWGDITQIATANLAAKYHDPVAVGIGATLGLWTAALLAISIGGSLLRVVSPALLHRVGAVIFLGFAVYSVVEAIRA